MQKLFIACILVSCKSNPGHSHSDNVGHGMNENLAVPNLARVAGSGDQTHYLIDLQVGLRSMESLFQHMYYERVEQKLDSRVLLSW
eukprot:1156094-Pelagomonas_calceolata.AAC.6